MTVKVERAFNHNVNRILNDINGYELEDSMSLAFVARDEKNLPH